MSKEILAQLPEHYKQKFKPQQDKNGNIWWSVYIPKKFIKKVKGLKGQFYILSFVSQNGEAKEAYLPNVFLKETSSGKGYIGNIKLNYEANGTVKIKTKITSAEWARFFPPYKMPKKNNET